MNGSAESRWEPVRRSAASPATAHPERHRASARSAAVPVSAVERVRSARWRRAAAARVESPRQRRSASNHPRTRRLRFAGAVSSCAAPQRETSSRVHGRTCADDHDDGPWKMPNSSRTRRRRRWRSGRESAGRDSTSSGRPQRWSSRPLLRPGNRHESRGSSWPAAETARAARRRR